MTIRELRVLVCKIPFELDDTELILQRSKDEQAYGPALGFDLNSFWNGEEVWTMDELIEAGEDLENYGRCVVFYGR